MRLLVMAAFALLAGTALAQPIQYPATPKKPVVDTYHGVTVTEDYRWLEDGADPAVREWSVKQLEVTRAYLDGLPQRALLQERFSELLGSSPVRYYAFQQTTGGFFALKRQPPKNQPMLVVMKSAGALASERVLLDPSNGNAGRTADRKSV